MSKQRDGFCAEERRIERLNFDIRAPFIFAVAEACVLLLLCGILSYVFRHREEAFPSHTVYFIILAFYILTAGTVCIFYSIKYHIIKNHEMDARSHNTEIYDMFRFVVDYPYAVVDSNGRVKVLNGALQDVLGHSGAISRVLLSDFCSVSIGELIARAINKKAYLTDDVFDLPEENTLPEFPPVQLPDGKMYEVNCYVMKHNDTNYYFVAFKDIDSFYRLSEKTKKEAPVVAYIMLDNLQELAQYVRADYRTASAKIETMLKEWVFGMNGFIREYDRDRYIAVFSKEQLDIQMGKDFPILLDIMGLEIGDNSFPVTVSMGIASVDGNMKLKEKEAFAALEVAIARGGNQIAVRREKSGSCVFFGGAHKTMENNTAVASRMAGEIIEEKIAEASNVLIMGHKNPDFDSIGSTVGMFSFVNEIINERFEGKEKPGVKIVMDKECDTFRVCKKHLSKLDIYEKAFISKDAAQDLVSDDTVLIITDVNNKYIFEAPELATTVNEIALIDHHRLANELNFTPFLQYVETTKSSASEIVSEIYQQSRFSDKMGKEEAELLMSGIMLDTNNFTRNAGSQTFAISHYLYGRGAHTEVVREFFNEDLEEVLLTSMFESKTEIYRDAVAISCMVSDRENPSGDRILASKVANNLLTVKGVEASFALIRIKDDIAISGRSKGRVNVQLILERLKGGGHFDMAGAQMRGVSVSEAREQLCGAIDDYYEYDYVPGNNAQDND